ncbi:MAG: retropepsin-like aspartic protease [Planctomycetota bacterium]|nr:retropepsin-like aspartic protease [Planctomycetota bacterium]
MGKDDAPMGKVVVSIEISSAEDEGLARAGHIAPDKVRRAELQAIVDTGATMLVLPEDTIARLGLPLVRKVNARYGDGRMATRNVYGSVRLTVLGRVVTVDALSAPAGAPALLGQIPLEGLDYLVDTSQQRLVPNPESPDPAMALVEVL